MGGDETDRRCKSERKKHRSHWKMTNLEGRRDDIYERRMTGAGEGKGK